MNIVDFHSHILPGIDDGSNCTEQSIAMLRMEADQGICQVVATPHFYAHHDTPEHFLQRRLESECRLRDAMAEVSGLPEIIVGAEVYYFPGISETDALSELTIAQKSCILLEMPHGPWTDSMCREIEGIYTKQGITPIIAHIDRYITPFKTYGIPSLLKDLPVLVQANASFFLNRVTRNMALRMLHQDQIHLLGSDCHNPDSRPPRLGDALSVIYKRLGQDAFHQIESCQEIVFKD